MVGECMNYKDSSLWCNSLGNDNYKDEKREKLCDEYESSRKNASFLLDKIRMDFPNLTVHDISHIDNMWHVASTIIGDEYEVNPLEGFILGCAFLVHDAVLSYDAIGGVEKLRETREWKDYYADYDHKINIDEEQKRKECDFKTIRLLHANRAEDIFSKMFQKEDRTSFYIINDSSLRDHLGELIGKIAASHHWNIDKVEELGKQFGVPVGFPSEWNIDPIKLACILRCADAGHIDGNRAPDLLMKSMTFEGGSKKHWDAQNKLSQVMRDRDDSERLVVMSNQAYEENDFAAWNVAYDLVKLFNSELKKSNDLLRKCGTSQFKAKSVRGAESQEELSSYIQTKGWKPCDAEIHISDVEHLIKTIGGEKLYGKENKFEIVLRELIQNARDAIVARRKRENSYSGKISVRIYKDTDETVWVEVIDNGIGMSIDVIKECLLNFGASFWKSDLMKSEFPGLNSSGFKSIGEFGIGFYSVFMVAKEVFVETRKYDKGLETAILLKFKNGFCLRPIITNVKSKNTDYSTIVRFSLDEEFEKWEPQKLIRPNIIGMESFKVPYKAVLANMVAGLDVDVYYSELGEECKIIHKDICSLKEKTPELASWLKDISYSAFRRSDIYSKYIDENYMRLEKVYVNGSFKGIIALNTFWQMKANFLGVETVGGLTTFNRPTDIGGYIGCFIAKPETARRNAISNHFEMHEWAKEQLTKILEQKLNNIDYMFLPYAISAYCIDISNITLIRCYVKDKNIIGDVRLEELIHNLNNTNGKIVFIMSLLGDRPRVDVWSDISRCKENTKDGEWLFIPVENSSFLSLEENNSQNGYSILDYINFIANRLRINVIKNVENGRFVNNWHESCSALILNFISK